jgi:cell wall-associated NlpC family hydrolase
MSKISTASLPTVYTDLRDRIKTGDLVFFGCTTFVSRFISVIETFVDGDGEYSHVGMCLRAESFNYPDPATKPAWCQDGKIFILESTSSVPHGDVPTVEGTVGFCVQLRDLDQVITHYGAESTYRIGVAHLLPEIRPNDLDVHSDRIQLAYDQYRGLYYDASVIDLTAIVLPMVRRIRDNVIYQYMRDLITGWWYGTARSPSTDQPADLPHDNCVSNWQFCSELVSNIYRDLGIYPAQVNPENILPSDIIRHTETKHLPAVVCDPIRIK